jgi:hypothetical protein
MKAIGLVRHTMEHAGLHPAMTANGSSRDTGTEIEAVLNMTITRTATTTATSTTETIIGTTTATSTTTNTTNTTGTIDSPRYSEVAVPVPQLVFGPVAMPTAKGNDGLLRDVLEELRCIKFL